MQRSIHHALACAAATAMCAGCSNHARRASDLPEPLSGPVVKTPPTAADVQREDLSKAAIDLQSAYQDLDAKQNGTDRNGDRPVTAPAADKPQGRARDRKSGNPQDLAANEPAALPDSANQGRSASKAKTGKAAADDRTAAQRKADAVTELATQMKPGIDGARLPIRAAMPLLGLEAIAPGSSSDELDAVLRAVTPEQRRTVGVARDLVRSLSSDPDVASGEPAALARVLREKADQLAGSTSEEGFTLGTVALCQRVDGFGRFTPLGVASFVAGRPAAMIVYTEIENFSQTRTAESSGSAPGTVEKWRVELAQSVRLYLDSDGSEQLTLPESVVRDDSTSRRHDFFLVQRLDLPKTVSVGMYNLKVSVRDNVSGALAERIIPIRVVADPSALNESRVRGNPGQVSKTDGSGRFAGTGK